MYGVVVPATRPALKTSCHYYCIYNSYGCCYSDVIKKNFFLIGRKLLYNVVLVSAYNNVNQP